jgi:hypothetical protein
MNSLLSFLLRSGGGVLREGAEILIGQALVRAATQRLRGILIFYSALAIFAAAALAFFYILLYRWLSLWTSDQGAAAILCGVNLLLIAAMFAGRALTRPKAPVSSGSPLLDLIKSHGEGLSAKDFEAGMAIGSQIGKQVRRAAPQIALAAVVLGLIIGVRPQILGLFRRRKTQEK